MRRLLFIVMHIGFHKLLDKLEFSAAPQKRP